MREQLRIIGRKPVLEAMQAGLPLQTIYIAAGSKDNMPDKLLKTAEKARIRIKYLDKNALQRMAGGQNHQGIIAEMQAIATLEIDEFLRSLDMSKAPAIAILDGIEDTRNLGAILRVADGAGLAGVVIPRRRSASLTPGAIKTSAGAAFHIPVVEVANLNRAMKRLQDEGFWLIGADMQGEKRIWEHDLRGPVGFVLGREGKGLHRLIREKCDFLVSIPMLGKVDSLNVATAAAVMFYELVRQRST